MKRIFKHAVIATIMVLAIAQVGYCALSQVGPVFPTDPTDPAYNGYPLWYRDSTGVVLELPVPPAGDGVNAPTMIFDPVVGTNPFSGQIGFGTEAFYYLANSKMDLPNGGKAELVMGIEAAFAQGDAIDGDQITFSRIRIRIDAPVAGTYTITHPYGSKTFEVTAPGIRAINSTADTGAAGPVFTGALKGAIGPYLKATTMAPGVDPTQWIGDGATLTTVTGSPNAFNKFRIDGPPTSDLGGPGVSFIETDQFTVSGKIFTGTPFTQYRSTYSRTALGATTVDIWARTAAVSPTYAIAAQIGAEPAVPLTRVGNRYFAHFTYTAGILPADVNLTATTGGLKPTAYKRKLTDVVSVTLATYSLASQTLTVNAVSSDLAGAPVLSVTGWGVPSTPLVAGVLSMVRPQAPPTVSVKSSGGGSQIVTVVIVP
ncbi:MAG: hypothetical protein WAW37_10105 [Syntrophobacteraceae bacterium]